MRHTSEAGLNEVKHNDEGSSAHSVLYHHMNPKAWVALPPFFSNIHSVRKEGGMARVEDRGGRALNGS